MENIWIICIFIFEIIVWFHVHSMSHNVLSNRSTVCVCVYYKMSIYVEMYMCKILEGIFKNVSSTRVLLCVCVRNKKSPVVCEKKELDLFLFIHLLCTTYSFFKNTD